MVNDENEPDGLACSCKCYLNQSPTISGAHHLQQPGVYLLLPILLKLLMQSKVARNRPMQMLPSPMRCDALNQGKPLARYPSMY